MNIGLFFFRDNIIKIALILLVQIALTPFEFHNGVQLFGGYYYIHVAIWSILVIIGGCAVPVEILCEFLLDQSDPEDLKALHFIQTLNNRIVLPFTMLIAFRFIVIIPGIFVNDQNLPLGIFNTLFFTLDLWVLYASGYVHGLYRVLKLILETVRTRLGKLSNN